MTFLHVRSVEHVHGYVLSLTFSDGSTEMLDLAPDLIGYRAPLQDLALFEKAYVDAVTQTVTWPGGIDIAPSYLYARAHNMDLPSSDADAARNEAEQTLSRVKDVMGIPQDRDNEATVKAVNLLVARAEVHEDMLRERDATLGRLRDKALQDPCQCSHRFLAMIVQHQCVRCYVLEQTAHPSKGKPT